MAATMTAATPLPRRTSWWRRAPLFVVGLIVSLVAVIWITPEDLIPRGVQMMSLIFGSIICLILLTIWGLFLSGAALRSRFALVAGIVGLVVIAAGSIRRVEFSGDMVPTVDFRWSETRDAKLEAARAASGGHADQIPLSPVTPEDMAEYRGPARDGIVVGPALAYNWANSAPKMIWRQPVGGGYSAMVVDGQTAVTIEQRQNNEAIVAYDIANGRERWVHEYPALFSEKLGGDGPRATPTIKDGDVYSFGATGYLVRLDGTTGQPKWSVNVLPLNGSQNIEWGMCSSPLVYDGRVVVVPGSQKGTDASRLVLAFDAESGDLVWSSATGTAVYSSPMLAELGGLRQIITFDASGLVGLDAADGRELWRADAKSPFQNSAAQPIVLPGDRLFYSNEGGCGLIQISKSEDGKWSAEPVWQNRNMKCVYANPIALDGYVYGLDAGILACLDLETGKRAWKSSKGRYGHGQMLLSGKLLMILTEAGELVLVEASPKEHNELGKIPAIEGKTWNNPALAAGRAYVRNHIEMACYQLPLAEAGGDPFSDTIEESAEPVEKK